MRATPLDTLLTLRKHELQAVERTFSEALSQEADAAAEVARAERHLIEEQKMASDPLADDGAVEAFSRWLPVGRAAINSARHNEKNAGLAREIAKSALMMARAAVETVETLQKKRRAEEDAAALRREQNVLDEVGARQSGGN
ncbi:flagellar export protein FliJ [Gluconobacter wancherniae]|uniref:Flagellar FliJ protein n=1 Tax=Gluconobacter wancherniae NBRC 103581 TaxID=656744 RepID=A0A511AWH8_9PROT|nr:flagellar export protein FliJ [Gluconobacter wancherniae]MBF0852748.1 flagellar FliJ family protein [Gluconobacter wancherniae]MBS1061908.1 flagellar FliJ family protein [Gluconobacter wancherniae]MBS1087635.1 flagellar FliJ family protein [Gluconobacter wancherniae]MBS1093318.1 flagellar FliJ family protein [Gluconobacter wancherniae]GBD56538.1 hypothetical protein NBRC103581_01116 [Gluconobacter wancherniae NBRC 103581]